ncbi:receptor-like protein Cf-9 homolog [Rutidosis leptorrhynchoides]|uniref:receptor-like protein Cf-9 homolog n=1 Tax=Rutidosis leptorrhynchoides TaxID=125765 RepID=UPI003A9A5C3F
MSNSKFVYFVFIFLSFACSTVSSYVNSSLTTTHKYKCSSQQSRALLFFKDNLFSINISIEEPPYYTPCKDWLGSAGYYPIMMNWSASTDCCDWNGVTCDHSTGDIIGLDLSCGMLKGSIYPNTSLFNLPHLQKLNLAFNNFYKSQVPRDIGRFSKSLTHLNISQSRFDGEVPAEITLLHKLVSLDLSARYFFNSLSMEPRVFIDMLLNSTSLENLMLSRINISLTLPNYLNISSSLKLLNLKGTRLQGKLPYYIFNLRSMEVLDLSSNDLVADLINISSSMKTLDLNNCSLIGSFINSQLNPTHLTYLDLSNNKLNGTLPTCLFTLRYLKTLYLYNNMLSGYVPFESFALPSLKTLDISSNNFSSSRELDKLLASLANLEYLDLSYSGLTIMAGNATRYVNPKLKHLHLVSCKINVFPTSLRSMINLESLDLSDNEINGDIPIWAGEIGADNQLLRLNLSHNSITGLPQFLWHGLYELDLQSNKIHGPLPPSICNMSSLDLLDLSMNDFSGVIPQCFGNFSSYLTVMNIANNNIHGTIPNTFRFRDCGLRGLILKGNQLQGELPTSLSYCYYLKLLDLENNHLNGTFPNWLEDLSYLQVLNLKSNNFHGRIATTLAVEFPFENLQVLDLSHNRFVGQIPAIFFENLNAMKNMTKMGTKLEYLEINGKYYSISVPMKGMERHLPQIYVEYTIICLSYNKFEGKIPNIIGSLNSLIVLDLSHNNLTGPIPEDLGKLSQIESLDLSWNQLKGEIPRSLVGLTFLAFLNISHNNLVGRIPTGKQFNTLEWNSFGGNPNLCGLPLPKKCNDNPQEPHLEGDEDDEENGFTWKVVMLGYGCGTVFGLVMGYLMLSTRRPKWFSAIADEGERMILTWRKKRRYITYIGR